MQTVARSNFTTVKTEGAILPADLLQRVADGELAGLRPQDYHLGPTEKLNEAINRAWNRCTGVWRSFDQQRHNLAITDSGVTLTRERWLLILFQELGYGRLPYQGKIGVWGSGFGGSDDSQTTNHKPRSPETYPISHLWGQTPIHLISFRQALDRRDPAIKRSPHSLVQEFLNRSEAHLWGIVSNGLSLRLLRDNVSLTRAAYLEFDLDMMMTGQLYADFSLLWLVCHQSRVEGLGSKGAGEPGATAIPADCWLEKWSQEAAEQGTRALDALRDGVQEAISALGRGFLAHPANGDLRRQLNSGELATQDYYRQLLRLVYRLIFLFVAEDRDLLLTAETKAEGQRYTDYYSLSRLRTLAEARRGGPHPDLYRTLRRVFLLLREGYPPLGLPALGSFLFSERSTPALDAVDLANTDLLNAIRALAFTIEGRVRRPVDYKNLGAEELGSVYESLLELHPQLNIAAATFELATAAGSERKTTGSYYTPASLINSLLDTALEPIIEGRLREAKKGVGSREIGNRGKTVPTPHSPFPIPSNEEEHESSTDSVVSRPKSVAGGHEPGREVLSPDASVPRGRDIRDDFPDSTGGGLDSGKHRRGQRSGEPGRVHPVSTHRSGITQGVGDASDAVGASGTDQQSSSQSAAGTMRYPGQDVESADSIAASEKIENRDAARGVGNRDTPPTPHSLPPYSPEEAALLSIKVVDPACGSGHFLIAAANRLALHLSRIRTGDDEPGPEARREAMRDVVRHCIHGVDINEMSVELCKVALWLETLDPGKPLTFLDANILCGNSLLGATPELLKEGIPDDAFKPITGDDRDYCKEWKARNKKERGQRVMDLDPQPWERLGDLATAMADLERLGDDSLARVQAQESKYADLIRSSAYEYSRLWADAWCAAFVWVKQPEWNADSAGRTRISADKLQNKISENQHTSAPSAFPKRGFAYPITEAVFRQIERNPFDVAPWMRQEIERLRDEYQFFHWHLAFPHVFGVRGSGLGVRGSVVETGDRPRTTNHEPQTGFDVVLGNPPWEMLELSEKEFFAARAPEIAEAPTARQRQKMITALEKENRALYEEFKAAKRMVYAARLFIQKSGRFPLSSVGRINLYPLFVETATKIQSNSGRTGIIVPSAVSMDAYNADLFGWLINQQRLVSLFDFENRKKVFEAVDSRYRFCLLTLCGSEVLPEQLDFCYYVLDPAELRDQARRVTLTPTEIRQFSPNTLAPPILLNATDARLAKAAYGKFGVLVNRQTGENPWQVSIQRMLSLSDKGNIFRKITELDEAERYNVQKWMRLYSGKAIHQFDHRYATYDANGWRDSTINEHIDPAVAIRTEYYARSHEVLKRIADKQPNRWLLGYRDVCRATDERTAIASIIPRVGCDTHCRNIYSDINTTLLANFVTNFNSHILDYFSRQKIISTGLGAGLLEQLPILPPNTYTQPCAWGDNESSTPHSLPPYSRFILPRVLELTYTAWDLQSFAQDCSYLGPPFRWDEERRFLLRCELDAAYFHLYGIMREDVDYIMETFPIVKRKDEAAHGEYRTKQVILDIYDEMQQAIAAGQPYQTHLDPPPADSRAAHPWDEAFGEEPEELWTEKSGDRDSGLGVREEGASYEPQTTNPEPPTTEPLILQNPVAEIKPPKKPKPTSVAQGSLLDVLPPPGGPRSVRLKRAMALGGDPSPLATRELVAFLADEDSNIRWLAGSTLVQRPTADTVAALAAFLDQAEPERVSAALPEARRVLSLIADTAEEESVRRAAGEVLGDSIKD